STPTSLVPPFNMAPPPTSTLHPYTTLFRSLYLTIGPFFAIPRCATVSYTVGIAPLAPGGGAALGVFSLAFFAVVLFFSLRPGQIESEEHTSELQSRFDLVCRLLPEKNKSSE